MSRIDHELFTKIKDEAYLKRTDALYQEEGFPEKELVLQDTNNQGRLYAPKRVYPVIPLTDGMTISIGTVKATCILTPGHTPGVRMLYLPDEQLLFTGDHVLFDITPNISVWHGVPHSLADYFASLHKIRALPVQMSFPAHRTGQGELNARIDQLIAHHKDRLDEICQAVRENPDTTAYEIAGLIRWSARGLPWAEFPPHQKWFAMGETLAHLVYLTDKGQIARLSKNGQIIYQITTRH